MSANIHSLRPRAGNVAGWEADIAMAQETKLVPHEISQTAAILGEAGWKMKDGRACKPQERKEEAHTQAASEANSGGAAILEKKPC